MTLDVSLAVTRDRVLAVQDTLLALRVATVDDGPDGRESVLVDTLGDAIDDALGLIRGAFDAAATAVHAAEPPLDVETVHTALVACHDALTQTLRRTLSELFTPRRGEDLSHIARRGQQWRMWSLAVQDATERCADPLCDALGSLAPCWSDFTERSAWLSVQTRASGRRVGARDGEHTPRAEEGVT